MGHVKHGHWFSFEYLNEEYRARYEDYGWSYATLLVQKKVIFVRKKWWLFGPDVEFPLWDTVSHDSREELGQLYEPTSKSHFYDAYETKRILFKILGHTKLKHQERI